MRLRAAPHSSTGCRVPTGSVLALAMLLTSATAAFGAEVPSGAREALAPVTRMIATLVAIAIGLGIAISGAVIVWGGIEKTMAGANAEAEHRAQRRIANGITGLIWMIVASVIVGTLTAIAVAYGLIDPPF
jgi:amino acid transporter